MRVAVAAVFLLLFTALPVHGQERPTDRELAEARALYQQGLELVEQARWADALRAFERSYELAPVGATLWNLAATLRALGRHRDARDALDRLIGRHGDDLAPELRERAERMRAESAQRLAVMALVDLPATPRAEVRVDNEDREDDGSRPLELEVDPGEHDLVVDLDGHRPFRWRGTFADGAREEVRVELVALPGGGGGDDGGTLPLWLGVAGGAALVAGIVLAIIVIGSSNDLEPNGDLVLRL